MHVRSIKLENYMAHNASSIDFPDRGVVLITGKNGSGKSGLQESVATACWGKTLRGTSPWRDKVPGRVAVQVDGIEVTRTRTKSGASELLLAGDVAERDGTTTKTQARLESIIGDFESWSRTSVLSSSDVAVFTRATDAERKRLIEQLQGVDKFEAALASCRSDLKRARDAVQNLRSREVVLAERLRGLRQKQVELRELATQAPRPVTTTDLAALRLRVSALREEVAACQAELRTAQQEVRTADLSAAQAARAAQQSDQEHALLHSDQCPTCEQDIPEPLRQRVQEEVRLRSVAARTSRRAATELQEQLRAQIAALEEDLEMLNTAHRDAVADAREAKITQENHDNAAEQAEKLLSVRRRLKTEVSTTSEELTGVQEKLAAAELSVAELDAVAKVLSYEGVRAQLLGACLTSIETVANSWLSRIAGGEYFVSLKPYKENKTGSVRDLISLDVVGAAGGQGYWGASNGQRRRIDVALLFALSEVTAAARNTAPGTLFVDEITDGLDAEGCSVVAEALRELARDRCVVVISHSDTFLQELRPVAHYVVRDGTVHHAGT